MRTLVRNSRKPIYIYIYDARSNLALNVITDCDIRVGSDRHGLG